MNLLKKCVVCGKDADFMACLACESNMRRQLADIPKFAKLASQRLEPRPGGQRGTERGFGLSMAALEASCGHDAIAVLECWVRDFRETYGLVPYGIASEDIPQASLLKDICSFLNTWLAKACEQHLAIDLFAAELRQQWSAMREGAGETPANSWVVACPADVEMMDEDDNEIKTVLCLAPIKIKDADFDAEVTCRSCKQHWKVSRLLYVGASAKTSGVYVDSEAAAHYLGVSERELRRMAKAGKVKREKGRYDIGSMT
jgi:hypothetical protein